MSSLTRCMAGAFVCAVVLGGTVLADNVVVQGVVENQTGQPIVGATVTLTVGGGGGAPTTATTDSTGAYSMSRTIMGAGGTATLTIVASAPGYVTATEAVVVQNLNDGTPDTVVQDFTLQAGGPSTGDSLYVTGRVRDIDSNDIPGATVTVSIITMTGTQTATATTNAQGQYSVAMINQNSGRNVTIAVTATGYQSAQAQVQIADPADGTADRITRNFTLQPIVYDTLVVTGRVIDSVANTGLVGASVVVSTGGIGGTVLDTITTGANGNFSARIRVETMPLSVTWRVEMAGYLSKTGQRAVVNDTAAIGTVALVALSTTDSVAYTVHGRVSDSVSGTAIRNAQVIVSIVFGSELVIRDTVTTNAQGQYTVTSARVPYQAGNNTVTVAVSANNYAPKTATLTVPTSTTDIVVNVALAPPVAVVRHAAVSRVSTTRSAVYYSLSGRRVGQAADHATRTVQLVLRRADDGVAAEKVIPAR